MSKLVRDKIPEIIKASGKEPVYHVEEDKDKVLKLLKDKLVEEAKEAKSAKASGDLIMELADVYEVMITLAKKYGVPLKHIQFLANNKRELRGGFTKGIVLDDIKN